MRVMGMMRIRNEARWIGEVLDSIRPLCSSVTVMDDHSTDNTRAICRAHGAYVLPSPFEDLNEGRDKNWLLEQVSGQSPEWIVHVDGDEILEPMATDLLMPVILRKDVDSIRLHVVYLWDTREQIRVDGIYGRFRRGSIFRCHAGQQFKQGFHCSNVPTIGWHARGFDSKARLLHLGYMHSADRIRKFAWYNEKDPGNERAEDCYRHMVLGDLPEFPATMKRRHGGPLELEPLNIQVAT